MAGLDMDYYKGLPYTSVPPVHIRTKYVHYPYKGLFIYIRYLLCSKFDFRNTLYKV
jgi:hypothetical protein